MFHPKNLQQKIDTFQLKKISIFNEVHPMKIGQLNVAYM